MSAYLRLRWRLLAHRLDRRLDCLHRLYELREDAALGRRIMYLEAAWETAWRKAEEV